jgi:hypothetical protein
VKRGGGGQKGSRFEREVCKQLSLWWSGGSDDAVFYRSHGSGARATARSRRGKDTPNSHGDVMAVDPSGQPLLDLMTIELKRGYNRSTFQDLVDGSGEWNNWIGQAKESAEGGGSYGWLIIAKRDKRSPLAALPWYLGDKLDYRQGNRATVSCDDCTIIVCRLDDLLRHNTPKDLKALLKRV